MRLDLVERVLFEGRVSGVAVVIGKQANRESSVDTPFSVNIGNADLGLEGPAIGATVDQVFVVVITEWCPDLEAGADDPAGRVFCGTLSCSWITSATDVTMLLGMGTLKLYWAMRQPPASRTSTPDPRQRPSRS